MMRARRSLATLSTLVMAASLALMSTPAAAADEPDWLAHINLYRTGTGLKPVTVDKSYLSDLNKHLAYM